ncbi:hypothetical protein NDU88_007197 [Pleurodeles waltl]|uniref:Uncharacterized protein n=1 Tax=Pleurodeles waltl TaxID=8319 RepID=A0AAV7SRS2_PLEWA|nr:hypothetical protein NDU88_007197 [Pleurodeles waltl]
MKRVRPLRHSPVRSPTIRPASIAEAHTCSAPIQAHPRGRTGKRGPRCPSGKLPQPAASRAFLHRSRLGIQENVDRNMSLIGHVTVIKDAPGVDIDGPTDEDEDQRQTEEEETVALEREPTISHDHFSRVSSSPQPSAVEAATPILRSQQQRSTPHGRNLRQTS